ncbi:hypothetical protein [Streptomyces microflavus]|uniref:hypothetical protein n=1 Tax=Streptomyces microflavus TaxID=1919 RepID=UPI0036B0B718
MTTVHHLAGGPVLRLGAREALRCILAAQRGHYLTTHEPVVDLGWFLGTTTR